MSGSEAEAEDEDEDEDEVVWVDDEPRRCERFESPAEETRWRGWLK